MLFNDLSAMETRVLGCLLEKERTTPENYPLSLNSLFLACNQSTNREPVVCYDDKQVEEALYALREKKLATAVFGAGSRVQKYRHNLLEHYALEPSEVAILSMLLLRGAQTPGELRTRIDRICGPLPLQEVEARLEALMAGSHPVVQVLPVRPGQKEKRYIQLLSDSSLAVEPAPPQAEPAAPRVSRGEAMEREVAALRAELDELRTEVALFRKQFE